MPEHNPYVLETTTETFEADVIDRSREVPVVIDFWAAWCQPCRMLGPILERLAQESAGRFFLVKADTEQLPEIASAFGVRSIPAVFAVRDGKVVDSFVGLLPESAIRSWVESLMPSPAETLAREALWTEAADPIAAASKYREALRLDPKLVNATIGLARVSLALGQLDEAGDLLRTLEARGFLEPDAERLKAELDMRERASEAGDLATLRASAAAEPRNWPLQLKLAEVLAAAGQYAEALERCVTLVEDDRQGTGEEARKIMLDLFQVIPDQELVAEYRRRLANALF